MQDNRRVITGITEVSYDAFRDITGQSAAACARNIAEQEIERNLTFVENQQVKAISRLILLHAELCGLYGDCLPVGDGAEAMRTMRCARSFTTRAMRQLDVIERAQVLKAVAVRSGIWMPIIKDVIESL